MIFTISKVWLKRFGTRYYGVAALVVSVLFATACNEIDRPKVEPFLAVTAPPRSQEIRWSNGRLPSSIDPAKAAAPPETDVVRALYDGLTDLDSKSLKPIPGVAERWESSDNSRVWTFHLRRDARWSNGETVTAGDFVRSWKRLKLLGDQTANKFLFENIVGMGSGSKKKIPEEQIPLDFLKPTITEPSATAEPFAQIRPRIHSSNSSTTQPTHGNESIQTKAGDVETTAAKPGVEAINDHTLRVTLVLPDRELPAVLANPIFRPVYGAGPDINASNIDADAVTNGAFRIEKLDSESLTLERSDKFWNRRSIALESVRFVSYRSAEAALDAYKKGEIDILTNAAFEPLALKLLTPFEDFRQTPHSALNFYEVNTTKPPFNDRRVREALAIAIDREKLTEGDLEGSMKAATAFFVNSSLKKPAFTIEAERAKGLLENAGYPNGNGFPAINLVINRNDTQQRVARSVARMWKQNLNLETSITVKETSEVEDARKSGDFDLIRRGMVLPVSGKLVGLVAIFGSAERSKEPAGPTEEIPEEPGTDNGTGGPSEGSIDNSVDDEAEPTPEGIETLTESYASFEVRAIPLYFPMSYALVKPYVLGYEINMLDAPSLKEMSIDSDWQPRSK